jgi:signal transduction histidine kinase
MTAPREEYSLKGTVDQPTVLIISDDAEFARAVTTRWQAERCVPAFTLMSGDVCLGTDPETFDVAIVGTLRPGILPAALATLEPSGKPILLLCKDSQSAQEVRETQPRVTVLRQHENWLDALVLLAAEALRRCEAMARARRAEQENAALQGQATLGRYMLEMRHNLNNALTSVLGNSELLLLEPGSLTAGARSQIDTIRNMAVRMHEILQRFSSIEKELSVLEKQSRNEVRMKSQAAASL